MLSSVILSSCRLPIHQELLHDVFPRLRNLFLSQKRAANDVAGDKDALHRHGLVRAKEAVEDGYMIFGSFEFFRLFPDR